VEVEIKSEMSLYPFFKPVIISEERKKAMSKEISPIVNLEFINYCISWGGFCEHNH